MRLTDEARQALEDVREAADGVLKAADVVEAARAEDSPLHGYFEWDDAEAAEKYRLVLARSLIARVTVHIPTMANRSVRVRAYTSLKDERGAGGGYRASVECLGDEAMKARMLETALGELEAFERRYRQLEMLRPVFLSIQALRETTDAAA